MLAIVREIGGFAGLAAILGLVVLSALYVTHARDVKRLREWAGGAPEGLGPRRAVAGRAVAAVGASRPRVASRQNTTTLLSRRVGARFAVMLVGLLAIGGLAAYGIGRLSDSGDHAAHTRADDGGSSQEPIRSSDAVKPGTVTVAVLNGTTVDGLAATLREQITAAGYGRGTIDVFSDQQLAVSVVEYAPGHLAAAKAVGRIVGVSRYEPVTANSRALARDATVIVIAGADKAR